MTADSGIALAKAHLLRAAPATVVWGHIPAHAPAALRIASGETVRIDTVSHQGLMKQDPAQYFGEVGVSLKQVLQDGIDIYRNVKRKEGDGEVNGTAIEISLTPTLQFIVHKHAGRDMKWPRAEDAAHHYTMGMDPHLDVALKLAVEETVSFLRKLCGLSAADAYALASLNVDFRIAEAVNNVSMVYGAIPKRLFVG